VANRVDLSEVLQGLENLKDIQTKVARSMAVAGGKIVRDEAKLRAPVETGTLRGAIYLAYREGKSTDTTVVYAVTWNSRKAPHGHLQEFGHWAVQGGKRGKGGTETSWVPAKPFLRPAFEASLARMSQAMMERGRERLAELLRDMYTPRDEEFV